MKTNDLIQLGALAAIGFLAYQKYGKGAAPGSAQVSKPPSIQPSLPSDFGVSNPNDATWGETVTEAGMGLQNIIDWAF